MYFTQHHSSQMFVPIRWTFYCEGVTRRLPFSRFYQCFASRLIWRPHLKLLQVTPIKKKKDKTKTKKNKTLVASYQFILYLPCITINRKNLNITKTRNSSSDYWRSNTLREFFISIMLETEPVVQCKLLGGIIHSSQKSRFTDRHNKQKNIYMLIFVT